MYAIVLSMMYQVQALPGGHPAPHATTIDDEVYPTMLVHMQWYAIWHTGDPVLHMLQRHGADENVDWLLAPDLLRGDG